MRWNSTTATVCTIVRWPRRAMSITNFNISNYQFWNQLPIWVFLITNFEFSHFWLLICTFLFTKLGFSAFQYGHFQVPNLTFPVSYFDISHYHLSLCVIYGVSYRALVWSPVTACDLLGGLGAAKFDTVGRWILRLSDTVKPLITDSPRSGQPLYSGQIPCPRLLFP